MNENLNSGLDELQEVFRNLADLSQNKNLSQEIKQQLLYLSAILAQANIKVIDGIYEMLDGINVSLSSKAVNK